MPLPDKRIPLAVMIIGTFELGVALLGLVLFALRGQVDLNWGVFLILLFIYGAMGTGLWAIQEWARVANVVLHLVAVPYAVFTAFFLGGPSDWRVISQIILAGAIVYFLTRSEIRHKFQTVVPKKQQK
jgi:hypothetical protein